MSKPVYSIEMSNYMQKCKFIPQLVCEMLRFNDSYILMDLEVFGITFKNQIFIDMQFFWKVRGIFVLSYLSKKVQMNRLDFCIDP